MHDTHAQQSPQKSRNGTQLEISPIRTRQHRRWKLFRLFNPSPLHHKPNRAIIGPPCRPSFLCQGLCRAICSLRISRSSCPSIVSKRDHLSHAFLGPFRTPQLADQFSNTHDGRNFVLRKAELVRIEAVWVIDRPHSVPNEVDGREILGRNIAPTCSLHDLSSDSLSWRLIRSPGRRSMVSGHWYKGKIDAVTEWWGRSRRRL